MLTSKQLSKNNSSPPRRRKLSDTIINSLLFHILLAKPKKVSNSYYQYVFLLPR